MKTNSRKKLLVSSIAMLMVSTVALGSATYAWFSTRTTATAEGLKASTTQASNLVLSKTGQDGSWVYELDYGMTDTTLEPVSTVNFSNWWTNTADEYDGGTSTSAPTAVAEANSDTYYVAKNLYIKNDGSEDLNVDWKLNVAETQTGDADFFRVAFVKISSTAPDGFVYANAADATPLDAEGTASTLATTDQLTGNLGTLEAGVAYQYRVYMYYEGTDDDCKDSNALNTCDVDFTFSKHV